MLDKSIGYYASTYQRVGDNALLYLYVQKMAKIHSSNKKLVKYVTI